MFGDADGYEHRVLEFPYSTEEGRGIAIEKLKSAVHAIKCCVSVYSRRGRSGRDEYNGLPEYDAFFVGEKYVDIEDYDYLDPEDILNEEEVRAKVLALLNTVNPHGIRMEHPMDPGSDFCSTIESFSVSHVDSLGNTTEITPVFNDTEKARFEECSKFKSRKNSW